MLKGQKKTYFTAFDGALGFSLGFGGVTIVQLIAAVIGTAVLVFMGTDLMLASQEISNNKAFIFIVIILNQLVYIGVYFGVCAFRKTHPFVSAALDKKPKILETLLVVGMLAISMYTAVGSGLLFDELLSLMHYTPNGLGFEFSGVGDFIFGIVAICILAPIGEELIYRGLLLNGLKNQTTKTKALLLSSLAFMIMHCNPEQTVYQFFLGLALGLVVLRTGKIWLAIIMHAVNNFFSLLNVYFDVVDVWWSLIMRLHPAIAYPLVFLLAAGGIVGIYFLTKLLKKQQPDQQEQAVSELIAQEKTKPANRISAWIIYWLIIGACAVMWVSTLVMRILQLA